jgi:hypothetical protein
MPATRKEPGQGGRDEAKSRRPQPAIQGLSVSSVLGLKAQLLKCGPALLTGMHLQQDNRWLHAHWGAQACLVPASAIATVLPTGSGMLRAQEAGGGKTATSWTACTARRVAQARRRGPGGACQAGQRWRGKARSRRCQHSTRVLPCLQEILRGFAVLVFACMYITACLRIVEAN